MQFLNLLLEYDAKTRSLPSAIAYVSEAFSVHHLERIPGGPQAAYRVASAGPLTSIPFLDELSRVVHSFLTPGQVLDLIGEVARRLADAYDGFRTYREVRRVLCHELTHNVWGDHDNNVSTQHCTVYAILCGPWRWRCSGG